MSETGFGIVAGFRANENKDNAEAYQHTDEKYKDETRRSKQIDKQPKQSQCSNYNDGAKQGGTAMQQTAL